MTVVALLIIILAALFVMAAAFKNYRAGRGNVPEYFAVHDGELAWISDAEFEWVER